jgi:4-amino-4-deoxy-L-arabinose transferase-like glycosyltransferase
LLLLGWIAAVLVFFSIPSGKRDVYILPALPMFCLALGPLLPGLLRRRAPRVLLLGFVLLLALLGIAGGAAALFGEPGFEVRLEGDRGLAPASDSLWWLLLGIGSASLLAALVGRVRRAPAALVASLSATWLLISFIAYPLLDASSSASALMRAVGEKIGPNAELGLVAWKEQNLLQADRAAATFGFRRPHEAQLQGAIEWQSERPQQRWVLILDDAMGECIDRSRAVPVGRANRREWWLFRAEAVAATCVASR